jgi:hypothetical protein
MRRGAGRAVSVLILCAACFGGASPPAPAQAPSEAPAAEAPTAEAPAPEESTAHASPQPTNEQVAAFSERITGFYEALEDVPLDALVTYENKALRDCFESPAAFSDYFSALATEARDMSFRDTTARSVRIREFHFASADLATVDVTFTSVHQRILRFWSIGFDRHDTWRWNDGVWQIVPEKL